MVQKVAYTGDSHVNDRIRDFVSSSCALRHDDEADPRRLNIIARDDVSESDGNDPP
jgi:hypothetical protein